MSDKMIITIHQEPVPDGPRGDVGERISVTATPTNGLWSASELNLSHVAHAIRQRWPGLRPGDFLLITVERVASPEVPSA